MPAHSTIRMFLWVVIIMAWGALIVLLCRCPPRAEGAPPPTYTLASFAPTADYQAMQGGWLLSWNGSRRAPGWTLERLTLDSFGNEKRTNIKFRHDPDECPEFAASPDDFNGFTAWWDRGHCAAAGNHNDTREHLLETFTIHNSMVQRKLLNEQLWRHLEDHCKPAQAGDVMWIATLPVYAPDDYPTSWGSRDATYTVESIGSNHQQIPSHCGKSICVQSGGALEVHSWLVPNEDPLDGKTFADYAVTTDELEAVAGMNLWKGIPNEKALEAAK